MHRNKSSVKQWLYASTPGQALVEYVLILVLVGIAFGFALAATGPSIGNIFSNTIYNLIGQTATPQNLSTQGGPVAFWQTVTAVYLTPQGEIPYPTNPPPPPTNTPTPGPSPTPTATVPTLVPSQTPTDPPTPTDTDYAFTAPFTDEINEPRWWRVDNGVFIGGDQWRAEYFAIPTSGTPNLNSLTVSFEQNFPPGDIVAPYGCGGPYDTAATCASPRWLVDNFATRYTRPIYVPVATPVRFTVRSDDGVRISLITNNVSTTFFDRWVDRAPVTEYVDYTIPAGFHTLRMDYYERTGGAELSLNIARNGALNTADANTAGGAVACNWGRSMDRYNTTTWSWDENIAGEGNANMRCHLEFRGYVDLATGGLANPEFVFWDRWDVRNTGTLRLQIAEYLPNQTTNWAAAAVNVTLHSSDANYVWSRQSVAIPAALQGRKITWRYIMETNGNGGRRRWNIDDISIQSRPATSRIFRICAADRTTCGSYWDMNAQGQANDFITTGNWELTSTNARTGTGSQMSWDSSPGTNANYVRNADSDIDPDGGGPLPSGSNSIIYYVELNGQVDISPGSNAATDADGDDGVPMLSFWQAYDIANASDLVVQWTRDSRDDATADNWQTIAVAAPAINPVVARNASNRQTNTTMSKVELPLDTFIAANGTAPFRMRFAFRMDGGANVADGWYIDDIYIERKSRPRFGDYPFYDGAEAGAGNWTGSWGITNASARPGGAFSFTDSPTGNYTNNAQSAFAMQYAFDLNNDSPENLADRTRNAAGGNSGGAAVRPILTFWHWRDIAATTDSLRVQSSNNGGATWTDTWVYSNNTTFNVQRAWERVQIDLRPLQQGGPGANANLLDDDVLIRFLLTSDGNANADGVYIDDITVHNYAENSFKLWDPAVTTAPAGAGSGPSLSDDFENTNGEWYTRWTPGGSWNEVTGNQFNVPQTHSGVDALHDSPTENVNTRHQTYNVLEMNNILDLRNTSLANNPTMYFWTRWAVGNNDSLLLQVSSENASDTTQAYNDVYGWNNWTTIWSRSGDARQDTWTREAINLNSYIGSRIRLRFVTSALTDSTNRDGWYIDDVQFLLRSPQVFTLPFYDPAQNTANWVTEGSWGLAPDKFRGSGGGPAALGINPWNVYYYDCTNNCGANSANTLLNGKYAGGNPTASEITTTPVTDINYNFGSNSGPDPANTWLNYYTGRWVRQINVQAGDFVFVVNADDGVRLRTGGQNQPWNIIDAWTSGNKTVLGQITLAAGNQTLWLEWFEESSNALLVLFAGKNNFSFSDSPKPTPVSADVNSTEWGNSSLILDGVVSLAGTTTPVLEYYTYYDLRTGSQALVEVSTDGGFTWTQANLTNLANTGGNNTDIFINANGGNRTYMPTPTQDWSQRRVGLTWYATAANNASRQISLRFRLDTRISSSNNNGTRDGWYITDITINQ